MIRAFLAFAIFFSLAATQAQTLGGYAGISKQNGSSYYGHSERLGLTAKLGSQWNLSLGGYRLTRVFPDTTKIEETMGEFAAIYTPGSNSYYELSYASAPTAEILARQSLLLVPHLVMGATDCSLGLNYKEYKVVKSGYLNPNCVYEFSDLWIAGLGVYATRTGNWMGATHADLIYKPTEHHSLRADAATGDTLEDAGLQAHFQELGLEYGYHRNRWHFFFSGTQYKSRIRDEAAIGFRLEVR